MSVIVIVVRVWCFRVSYARQNVGFRVYTSETRVDCRVVSFHVSLLHNNIPRHPRVIPRYTVIKLILLPNTGRILGRKPEYYPLCRVDVNTLNSVVVYDDNGILAKRKGRPV